LDAIDMDSYRLEKQATQRLSLEDEDHEIDPVPLEGGGNRPEPELERLSAIIQSFNDLFGNIDWADTDRIRKLITEDIPQRVAADEAYRNAQANSDKPNARIELDKALRAVIVGLMKDDTQLFKQFSDNADFRRWLSDSVFNATYRSPDAPPPP
jgi:type I restriction enzyme R subunit